MVRPQQKQVKPTPRKKRPLQGRYVVRLQHVQSLEVETVPFGVRAKAEDLFRILVLERRPELICAFVFLHEINPDGTKVLLAVHRGGPEVVAARKRWLAAGGAR